MTKRAIAPTKEAAEEMKQLAKGPLPEISFSEQEVQKIADFINFVFKNGTFNMQLGEMKKISIMLNDMHAHVAKIEKYILEFRKIASFKKAAE